MTSRIVQLLLRGYLAVGRATVPRLQSGFRRRRDVGDGSRQGWGGRRRTLMSEEEEQEFLRPWAEQALARVS